MFVVNYEFFVVYTVGDGRMLLVWSPALVIWYVNVDKVISEFIFLMYIHLVY